MKILRHCIKHKKRRIYKIQDFKIMISGRARGKQAYRRKSMRDNAAGIFIYIWMALALLLGGAAEAGAMERFDIITTHELKQILEKRQAGAIDFLLVNTLDRVIFDNGAIPGSINLPWARVRQEADRLGPDKDRLIITY